MCHSVLVDLLIFFFNSVIYIVLNHNNIHLRVVYIVT